MARSKKIIPTEKKKSTNSQKQSNKLRMTDKTKNVKCIKVNKSKGKENEPVNLSPHCSRSTRSKTKFEISQRQTRSKSIKVLDDTQNKCIEFNEKKKPNEENKKIVKRIDFVCLLDYNVGSIVLAKQKYSHPWPAQIKIIEKKKVFVYFFGDKRNGYVDRDEIYDFLRSCDALKLITETRNRSRSFFTGISEAEALLQIPKELSILLN